MNTIDYWSLAWTILNAFLIHCSQKYVNWIHFKDYEFLFLFMQAYENEKFTYVH